MDRGWCAIALAVASGVATSPGPAAAAKACALRGFVPAPRKPGPRPCDQLEQGCWLSDHPGYFELREWIVPHPIGYWFRSNADLDGDGRLDCFTAVLTLRGWTVEARRGAEISCVQGPTFHPPAAYVMSRHLHAAAGPTA